MSQNGRITPNKRRRRRKQKTELRLSALHKSIVLKLCTPEYNVDASPSLFIKPLTSSTVPSAALCFFNTFINSFQASSGDRVTTRAAAATLGVGVVARDDEVEGVRLLRTFPGLLPRADEELETDEDRLPGLRVVVLLFFFGLL